MRRLILTSNQSPGDAQVAGITGGDPSFWIVNAGRETDFPAKSWDHARFQQVMDHFSGRILLSRLAKKRTIIRLSAMSSI